MKQIPLPHGEIALVDDADFALYGHLNWRRQKPYRSTAMKLYVCRGVGLGGRKVKTVFLHKLIAGTDGPVRHRNGDPLDNRRENLIASEFSTPTITDEQWILICRRYVAGERTSALAAEFGVKAPELARRLRKHGFEARPVGVRRREYTCNHSFFKSIDTEPKAYWLGFLAADGCNTGQCLTLQLSAVDMDHVLSFLDTIESDHPVYVRPYYKGTSAGFSIASPEMTADLSRLGVVPRKAHILQWPDLRPDLMRHYLRGYFDGDGCFSICKGFSLVFTIAGNETFLRDCQSFLIDACRLNRTKIKRRRPEKPSAAFFYTGNRQCLRILNLLYSEATVWLPRKRDKALAFINERQGLHGWEIPEHYQEIP